jgi:CRISPR-associated protein Cas2
MSSSARLYVICYDVVQDKARRRLARFLEKHALRVQDSVFEVRTTGEKLRQTWQQAVRLVGNGDSVRAYALDAAGRRESFSYGPGPRIADEGFVLL